MTETEWWQATEIEGLIRGLFFTARASDRKLRLFSVACCRQIERHVSEPALLQLLELSEGFADSVVEATELNRVAQLARNAIQNIKKRWSPRITRAVAAIFETAKIVDESNPLYRTPAYHDVEGRYITGPYPIIAAEGALLATPDQERTEAEQKQLHLLRDIFGPLPLRAAVDPEWLTSDVTALARGIYDEKAFDRMPILADALQDAGCDNDEILCHCRSDWLEHVRGCWVIDSLLGRPWREPSA